MDLDRLQRYFTIGAILSAGLVAVAQLGERLGWWNDFGDLLTLVGAVAAVLLGVIAVLIRATKGQLRLVAGGVVEANRKLDGLRVGLGHRMDATREELGSRVDAARHDLGSRLDRHTEILSEIRDLLRRGVGNA